VEIISLLVDNGASTVARNGGCTGPNVEKLAEQTKDAKVIRALKPKGERSASRGRADRHDCRHRQALPVWGELVHEEAFQCSCLHLSETHLVRSLGSTDAGTPDC